VQQYYFIQANPTKAVLSEKNGKLRLVFEKIYGIDTAREVLGEVAGTKTKKANAFRIRFCLKYFNVQVLQQRIE
jgi:hypothetical protein